MSYKWFEIKFIIEVVIIDYSDLCLIGGGIDVIIP